MNEQILALELRLLILRYGRRRIIEALARLGEQTPEAIDGELIAALESTARKRKRAAPPTSELIAIACRDRPEINELVTFLIGRFENHTFLPQLRDVARFFDRLGISHGKPKSRRDCAPAIINALAKLDVQQLQRFAAAPTSEGESDLALLAREIMSGGRPPRPLKE